MSLIDTIATFNNAASYTLVRTPIGSSTLGRYTAGTPANSSITGSLQPPSLVEAGRALQVLPEGEHSREIRVFFTTTEIHTRTPTHEPDKLTIDSETWEVIRAETWQYMGNAHYRALLARVTLP